MKMLMLVLSMFILIILYQNVSNTSTVTFLKYDFEGYDRSDKGFIYWFYRYYTV